MPYVCRPQNDGSSSFHVRVVVCSTQVESWLEYEHKRRSLLTNGVHVKSHCDFNQKARSRRLQAFWYELDPVGLMMGRTCTCRPKNGRSLYVSVWSVEILVASII